MSSHHAIQVWVSSKDFLLELQNLLQPVPIAFDGAHFGSEHYWPNKNHKSEKAIADHTIQRWWKPNTGKNPTWDVMIEAKIAHQNAIVDALILIEAKGHHDEMSAQGKEIPSPTEVKKTENHRQIQKAIKEAERGWKALDSKVCLSETEHYQLANRMAHAWKVAEQGTPVVLVYLGLLNEAPAGKKPFVSAEDWNDSFLRSRTHGSKTVVPDSVFEKKWMISSLTQPKQQTPLWVLNRSLSV